MAEGEGHQRTLIQRILEFLFSDVVVELQERADSCLDTERHSHLAPWGRLGGKGDKWK